MPVEMQGGTQGVCMRQSDVTQDWGELSVLQATLEIYLGSAEIIPRCLPQCNYCCLGISECFDFTDYYETLDTACRRVPKFSSADKKSSVPSVVPFTSAPRGLQGLIQTRVIASWEQVYMVLPSSTGPYWTSLSFPITSFCQQMAQGCCYLILGVRLL